MFFPAPSGGGGDAAGAAAAGAAAATAAHTRQFYTAPPTAFALVAYPHVAYFLALEWVGKVLVSPVSQPFLLGSPQHAAAAAALHQHSYAPPEALDLRQAQPWLRVPGREGHAWCVQGGTFRKLVRGDANSGQGFAAMHAAYAALQQALPRAPPHLRLPASVRLLYGLHELLVEMPAVAAVQRTATEGELQQPGGVVLAALARTIAWLARQGIICTDLRSPNVLVDAQGLPWLVDYDDCAVAPTPVTCLEGYLAAVAASPGALQAGTFAASLGAGREGALVQALKGAFEEEGAE